MYSACYYSSHDIIFNELITHLNFIASNPNKTAEAVTESNSHWIYKCPVQAFLAESILNYPN